MEQIELQKTQDIKDINVNTRKNVGTHKIVVSETEQKKVLPKVLLGLIGLAVIAVAIAWEILPQNEQTIVISIALMIAAMGFGTTSILSWRKREEKEIISIGEGKIKLQSSLSKNPTFNANIDIAKIQRLRLPSGKIKLYLRDGIRAVEIGGDFTQEQRHRLADELESIIGE